MCYRTNLDGSITFVPIGVAKINPIGAPPYPATPAAPLFVTVC